MPDFVVVALIAYAALTYLLVAVPALPNILSDDSFARVMAGIAWLLSPIILPFFVYTCLSLRAYDRARARGRDDVAPD